MMTKVVNILLVIEVLLHVILVLLSLTLSAADSSVRNILSPEGIRWFFLHVASNLSNEGLVYLLGFSFASGAWKYSGLGRAFTRLFRKNVIPLSFRQRRALWFAFLLLILLVVIILLLTCLPHAVLISATGNIYPSPFSSGFLSYCFLTVIIVSITYGAVSNTLHSFHEVAQAIYMGLGNYSGWIFVYLMATQLYSCFKYIYPNLFAS